MSAMAVARKSLLFGLHALGAPNCWEGEGRHTFVLSGHSTKGVAVKSSRNTAVSVVSAVCPVLTLVGVLVSPLGLRAQEAGSAELVTLEGEVVDASNNRPVEGAIVSFPDFGLIEVTDSLGNYRVRYIPPVQPRGIPRRPADSNGCLRLVTRLGTRSCAMIVIDGVPIDGKSAGWMYQTSSHDISSVRFLYGPEATLRYGHRGEAGVLLIRTHQGR